MLATLTNGRFSVPENPVMRATAGFGLLQAGNGSAFGQSVDLSSLSTNTDFSSPSTNTDFSPDMGSTWLFGSSSSQGLRPGNYQGNGSYPSSSYPSSSYPNYSSQQAYPSQQSYQGGASPTQVVNEQGQFIWSSPSGYGDGSPYTADFCNKIITGGTATTADKFQCSLRGYVGASAVYAVPPALVPAAPTSVTIPAAINVVTSPRVVAVATPRRIQSCSTATSDVSVLDVAIALGALAVGFMIMRRS
jgi:hypothetical protein